MRSLYATHTGFRALFAALAIAFALVAHLIVDSIGATGVSIVSRLHVGLAAIALALFVVSYIGIIRGSAAERRRRAALVGASLRAHPVRSRVMLFGAQALVAFGALGFEGSGIDLSHIGIAIVCGAIALWVSGALVRALHRSVVRFCAERSSHIASAPRAFALAVPAPPHGRGRRMRLALANRAPPEMRVA